MNDSTTHKTRLKFNQKCFICYLKNMQINTILIFAKIAIDRIHNIKNLEHDAC